MSDLVQNGYEDLGANPTKAQRLAFKEAKKKYCKALFYIQQNVDNQHFEKISNTSRSKEAWDILENYHNEGETVKQIKLKSYIRKYEIMQMEEDQKVSNYFSKMTEIVNLMKNRGENISDQMVVEKVLRSLNPKFDFIVVAIQKAKDVKSMKIEKLQSSLEVHELLVIEIQKDLYNKLFKHKHPRKREITRISSKRAKVKQTGPTMESIEHMAKLNLQE